MQRSLWASQAKLPLSPHQNMALLWHIEAALDPRRLATAFEHVVAASDALRTTIVTEQGHALAQLRSDCGSTELLTMSRPDALEWVQARAAIAMNPAESLFDSVVIDHEDGTVSWFLNLHHAITDATASATVFAATAQAYAGAELDLESYYDWPIPKLICPARSRRKSSGTHARWRPASAASMDPPGLGAPRPIGSPSTSISFEIKSRHYSAVDSPRSAMDMAWTSFLLTATAAFIHRTSGAESFSIGLPLHNRSGAQAQAMSARLWKSSRSGLMLNTATPSPRSTSGLLDRRSRPYAKQGRVQHRARPTMRRWLT